MSAVSTDSRINRLLRDPLSLLNSLEDAVLLLDRKYAVVFINRKGEEFFGKGHREIVGRKLREIFPDTGSVLKLAGKAMRELRSFSAKDVEAKINGVSKVDFQISPFFLEDRCEGTIVSIREDISIVEKEDSSFDSLVYLLGSIAHEIKNPLGGIKGAAQLLSRRFHEGGKAGKGKKPSLDNSSEEYIDLIIKETDRLNTVLQGYLTISKKPFLHQINIHEVVEKALSIMNVSLKNVNILLLRKYDPSLPRVIGDEGKLLQVFLNIIKNAVEAMPRGGTLTVATKLSSEHVVQNGQIKRWAVISIGDTGRGISKGDIHKIFLPFYTKKKKGTGLGLSLSKKIVKDHRGFIRVESPAHSGKGTLFHIYVPFS